MPFPIRPPWQASLSFADVDDCDHDGDNQPQQTPVGGETTPENTEELGTINGKINRHDLDADLDHRKAEGGRQHDKASTSSHKDKGRVPRGEMEAESRNAINRSMRTWWRSIKPEQKR